MNKISEQHFGDSTHLDVSEVSLKNGAALPKSILITIDATHAGYINNNGFRYNDKGMEYAVMQDTWLKPFGKPLIPNHNTNKDPFGRVVANRFIRTSDSAGFTQLDVEVTDEEAIKKILDKRYLTVSTHGVPMMDAPEELRYIKCSICGQNHLTAEDWCGHKRGEIYETDKGKKEKCFWDVGALDYVEVSVVNRPADQRKNKAATITNIALMDGEETPKDFYDEYEETIGAGMVFLDSEVYYPTEKDADLSDFKVANDILWEAVDHDKQAYIKAQGLLYKAIDKTKDKKTTEKKEVVDATKSSSITKDSEGAEISTEKEPLYFSDWDEGYLTDAHKGGLEEAHKHVVYCHDELGNGWTDYVNGHSHKVVDGKLRMSVIPGTNMTHTHTVDTEVVKHRSVKYLLTKTEDHRHVAYINAAGNGWSSYVDGHSHTIVGGVVHMDTNGKHTHEKVEFSKVKVQDVKDAGAFISLEDVKNAKSKLENDTTLYRYYNKILEDAEKNEQECVKVQELNILRSLEQLK